MEIIVNEQPKRFYLADVGAKKWAPAVGHEIKVGKHRFCAIVLKDRINISEVTTGTKTLEIPLSLGIYIATADKEGAMKFFGRAGEGVKRLMERVGVEKFDEQIEKMRGETAACLGEMPPIEDVQVNIGREEDA